MIDKQSTVPPSKAAASPGASSWAKANRKTNSKPEVLLRSELHRRGHRFRKNHAIVLDGIVVRPDLVFVRRRLAVFVEDAFGMHVRSTEECPEATQPTGSTSWSETCVETSL